MPVVSIPLSQKTWRKHADVVNLLEALAEKQTEVGRRLEELRRLRGLSQEGAAHKAGVSLRQWQRWETGESEPRNSTLARVAENLDVGVSDLMDEQLPTKDFADQLDRIETAVLSLDEQVRLLRSELAVRDAEALAARDGEAKKRSA